MIEIKLQSSIYLESFAMTEIRTKWTKIDPK